ncbi:DUF6077 domain-containing protein [Gordoniibacillus kamchatkensis]|uniref:DUF6077 domain-containing protein n=1 Tax=Gordoniibacillus kamchatkensis TaxID=1590651 RepID=UPI0026A5686A
MILILKSVLFIFVFFMLMYLLGRLVAILFSAHKNSGSSLLLGFIVLIFSSHIVAIPLVFTHNSFKIYVISILAFLLFISIFSIIKLKSQNQLALNIGIIKYRKYYLLCFTCIIFQVLWSSITYKLDYDDSFYLSLINQNINSNSLYLSDPSTGNPHFSLQPYYSVQTWELFLSLLSYLFRIPPAIMAHLLIPIIVIPLSYLSYYCLFKRLMPNKFVPVALIFFIDL